MTIVVPVAVSPPPLPQPDPTDRATFSTRKLSEMEWSRSTMIPGVKALADASYANALDAEGNATIAATKATDAQTSAALAAGYAGAALWSAVTVYPLGGAARSPIDGRVYLRRSAGLSATDPSADPTNWKLDNNAPLLRQDIAGTSQVASVGVEYYAINVAATQLVLPATPQDGDRIKLIASNGLKTNTIDSGAVNVRGPNAVASGVITLDLGAPMELIYKTSATAWVTL